jgi:hypothetical protein
MFAPHANLLYLFFDHVPPFEPVVVVECLRLLLHIRSVLSFYTAHRLVVLLCVFSVSVWKFRFSTVNYTTTADKHTVCNWQLPDHLVIWRYVTLGNTWKKNPVCSMMYQTLSNLHLMYRRRYSLWGQVTHVWRKLFFLVYLPETVKRTEVSWMLLRETRCWKGDEHSDCDLRNCDTV